jgi:hypothetical protein
MMSALRRRFWLEGGLGALMAVLFVVTLVQREWIETLFGVDPDQASGSLEWSIVGGLLLVTLVLFSLAALEVRRAATVAASA